MEGSPAFGQGLKQRRTALGLSQRDLAARVGCSAVTIRKFESGDRRPSWQLADLLAGALEIPEADRAAFVRAARAGSPSADGPPPVAPTGVPDPVPDGRRDAAACGRVRPAILPHPHHRPSPGSPALRPPPQWPRHSPPLATRRPHRWRARQCLCPRPGRPDQPRMRRPPCRLPGPVASRRPPPRASSCPNPAPQGPRLRSPRCLPSPWGRPGPRPSRCAPSPA